MVENKVPSILRSKKEVLVGHQESNPELELQHSRVLADIITGLFEQGKLSRRDLQDFLRQINKKQLE